MKQECYELELKGYSQREIADKLNVNKSTVSRAISSITKGRDYRLGLYTMITFVDELEKAADYWRFNTKELEELKDLVYSLELNDTTTALAKVDSIRRLMETQSNQIENLVTKAVHGKFVLAIMEVKKTERLDLKP